MRELLLLLVILAIAPGCAPKRRASGLRISGQHVWRVSLNGATCRGISATQSVCDGVTITHGAVSILETPKGE
jgi:hypothetical protein